MYTIHLGISGFPKSNATMQRIRLTFKAIQERGSNTLIINKASVTKIDNAKHVERYDDLVYVNTSSDPSRPDSFIARNLNKLSGFFGELALLYRKRKSINSAIFYSSSFWELLYYSFLSRIFNFKLVVQFVEYRTAIATDGGFMVKLNNYLFDNYCFFYCDGIIAISEFLKEKSLSKRKDLPIIKVPAITNFDDFAVAPNKEYSNYLMYCGTVEHLPLITFILDLFERLKTNNVYGGNLMLIIGGNNADGFNAIDSKMKASKFSDNIFLIRNVPHKNIPGFYVGADLLLIPLRKTKQDMARFPHKISEYTASKIAFLSTNMGDVGHYFKDGDSAILAEEYTVDNYYDTVSKYLSSQADLKKIGENGYKIGMQNFNYRAYSKQLEGFLSDL